MIATVATVNTIDTIGPAWAIVLLGALATVSGCRSDAGDSTTTTATATNSTPVERAKGDASRGRTIFIEGVSRSGTTIEATLAGDVTMDAAMMPCVGCHGEDGQGRPEGGMQPSNITWEALSKPYGGGRDGREHRAYDLAAVRKAITLGVDPSGNELLRTMPRYQLSSADLDDLVAYLQVLGEPWAVGVSDSAIALSTILATGDPSAATVEAVVRAYLAEINARGGVFGRRLELDVVWFDLDAPAESIVRELESTFAKQPPFAVLAPRLGDAEAPLLDWLAAAGVPVIGPATNWPDPGSDSVFHVDGGIPAQALALAEFATSIELGGELGDEQPRAIVVHSTDAREVELAQRVLTVWESSTLAGQSLALTHDADPASLESALLDADIVLFLGPADAVGSTLARSVAEHQAPSWVLLPGSLRFGDPFALPRALDGRVFLAYPWLPEDFTPAARRDYEALVAAHGLSTAQRPVQLATLGAGSILLEALARSGRGVTRASLVATLERFSEFQTGLGPPISFGPNRRVGVDDQRVVRVELEAGRLELVPQR